MAFLENGVDLIEFAILLISEGSGTSSSASESSSCGPNIFRPSNFHSPFRSCFPCQISYATQLGCESCRRRYSTAHLNSGGGRLRRKDH